jgi:hypothetical protein
MQQLIICHLSVMRETDFQIRLQELFGQQSALTTLVGEDYNKFTHDDDAPADVHMKMISLVFPYEFAIELLTNSEFLHEYMRTVLWYKVEKHLDAVSTIFQQIKQFEKLSNFASNYHFFTAQNPMYFSMAETFVTLFARSKMLQVGWDDLRNFAIEEKCALIARQGAIDCGLNTELVARLRELGARGPEDGLHEYLRPIKELPNGPKNVHIFDPDQPEELELPELYHVVLELRKMPLAISPSAMLGVLSNAIFWLTTALHEAAGQKIGADEIFQFFVFSLSVAKLWCLPGLLSFVDSFIDEALRETKFEYYIEQMRSALDFIDHKVIPVQPYVLLPNYDLPLRLARRLKPVGDAPIAMKGFEVFAFPIWARECELFFPALLRYEGSEAIAICRQYRVVDGDDVAPTGMRKILTLHGTFFQLPREFIAERKLIRLTGGDYAAEYEDLAMVSAMIQMLGCNVANPSTAAIDKLLGLVAKTWKIDGVVKRERSGEVVDREQGKIQVNRIVADLQKALVLLEFLPMNFAVDAKMNLETVEAMKVFFKQNTRSAREFVFDWRFFDAIVTISRKRAMKM